MKITAILLLLLNIAIIYTQNPPVWPSQFQMDFNETASLVATGKTTGTIYFDFKNNRQVVTRANGRYDRYCGTVFKFTDTPCNHIIVESTIYII
jgi:hypothetical protein